MQLGHAVDARLQRSGVDVLCVLVGAALLLRELELRASELPAVQRKSLLDGERAIAELVGARDDPLGEREQWQPAGRWRSPVN